MQAEQNVEINRPIEEVFAYVTTVSNWPHFMDTTNDAHMTSSGPIGTGSTFEAHGWFGGDPTIRGGPIHQQFEVTTYTLPAAFSYQLVDGPAPSVTDWTFEPTPQGTRVTLKTDAAIAGMPSMLTSLFETFGRMAAHKDLDRLKHALETDDGHQ